MDAEVRSWLFPEESRVENLEPSFFMEVGIGRQNSQACDLLPAMVYNLLN